MVFRTKSKIPGWFVGLAVLVTAGLTGWAIFKKSGGTWPDQTGSLPMQVTEVFSPTVAAMNPNSFQRVAGTRQVPVIRTGSVPKHQERGACTLCHTVVDALGKAIPSIGTMARLPHNYRGGLCINCHRVGSSKSAVMGGFGTLAAGQAPAPTAGPMASPRAQGGLPPLSTFAPRQGQQQQRQPSEGAWLGMEVVPITRLTAIQYGIPANMRGLVVAEAEGQAATSGVTAGDVVVAVNGIPISDMQTFLQATGGGKQQGGSVDLMRSGRFLKVVLGQAPRIGAVQVQPGSNTNTNTNTRPVATAPMQAPGLGVGNGNGNGNGNGYGFGRGRLGMGQGGGATCPNGLQR